MLWFNKFRENIQVAFLYWKLQVTGILSLIKDVDFVVQIDFFF